LLRQIIATQRSRLRHDGCPGWVFHAISGCHCGSGCEEFQITHLLFEGDASIIERCLQRCDHGWTCAISNGIFQLILCFGHGILRLVLRLFEGVRHGAALVAEQHVLNELLERHHLRVGLARAQNLQHTHGHTLGKDRQTDR